MSSLSVSKQAIHQHHRQLQFGTHYEMYRLFNILGVGTITTLIYFLYHSDAHDFSKA